MDVWLWHWNQSPIIPVETSSQVRSNVKVLLPVYHKFLPPGRMVNKEYYLEVSPRLAEIISQKRIELWKNQKWILHHDCARASISILVWVFGQKQNRNHASTIVSPDLAPADFFLSPKLKTPMKGKSFATIEEIKEKSKTELLAISKSVSRIGKNAGISI